ncbi:Ecdysteroid UDP-glucosyltransferase [Habropoda laboriosa]|uniref:Ecdysteroid UDP-glucosyltransferase n=2 Tax=Habropoda laboriosa TaxID=597456 RepID=A0A0L7RFI4_9HYME|nr:Ecdysteroid UDP-glucosyltransferase [Habropoda laboriosa]
MKFTSAFILSVLHIFCIARRVNGARILAVIPIPAYSHQIPFRPLWLELHKRGHELVIVAPNDIPNMNTTTNFTQINVGSVYSTFSDVSFVKMRLNGTSWLSFMKNDLLYYGTTVTDHTLSNPDLKKLYAPESNEKFDVVFVELYYLPAIHMLAHRFNAPLIGLNSFGIPTVEEYSLGGLVLPSHISVWEMEGNVGTDLPFWKRLMNFWNLWHSIYIIFQEYIPTQQMIAEKHFEKPIPPVLDVVKNMSLVFVNQDPVISYARPNLPNAIMFHSTHVSKNVEPLPRDLKRFVDSAKNGFIYVSFGTNAQFKDFPLEIRQIFYDVLARLPYKVVFKNNDNPKSHDNIYFAEWIPQQSILAHPNIKLYIFQGGLQSTQEAIYHTVPVLGLPIASDQEFQLRVISSRGIGNCLYFENLTPEMLESTILEMIPDPKYRKNMITLRGLVNDTPYNMLQNLVWWTEYVIRNKGALHYRTNLASLPWYQYCDMDIVAFLAIVAFIIASIVLTICVQLFTFVYKRTSNDSVNLTKKRS